MSRRRQQTAFWKSGTNAGPPRGRGDGTFREKGDGTGETYLAVESDKDRVYKAGRRKALGARRESEGFIVPKKACNTTRWREGALL